MITSYYTKLITLLFYKTTNYYPSNIFKIIVDHTFGKSFKFPENITNNRLIVIRYFFKTLTYNIDESINFNDFENLIFDAQKSSKNLRIDYLRHYTKIKDFDFISYNELLFFKSNFNKISYFFYSLPFVLLLTIISQFYQNRSSFALLIEYPIVLNNLFSILNKNSNISSIYYFSIVERESNIFAYFFQEKKVKVIKIASDTPIVFWNKNILSNDLLICNKYQFEEINFFKSSIHIENIKFFGPELSLNYNHLYNINTKTVNNTIGFYSTASWVRESEGHIDQGIDFLKYERKVLECIKKFLSMNSDVKLFIFLHPKEKTQKYFKLSLNYYKDILDNTISYELVNSTKSSSQLFHTVDLGVAFNSTILHERLYCGFKTLFYPNNPYFPIKNSHLSNICANNENDFENLIKKAMRSSTSDFFKDNNLVSYSNRPLKNF